MIKKLIWFGALTSLGFSLLNLFRQMSQYSSLARSLPEYLKDITGFRPKFDSQFRANHLKIEIGYPESVMSQEENLEQVIKNYISDYYNLLAKYRVNVKIYPIDY